jgi:hypothetical protein
MNASMPHGSAGAAFFTPLDGAYDYRYEVSDQPSTSLYELGKAKNWNASADVDWSLSPPPGGAFSGTGTGLDGYPAFDSLSGPERERVLWRYLEWNVSQLLHGEQGALLVASQLVSCVPDTASKLYCASQTFDEARHVEALKRYLDRRELSLSPVNKSINRLLSKILTDQRWDLKLIGMQIVIEGVALAAFANLRKQSLDPLLTQIVSYILKDESRHVRFGLEFLGSHLATLSATELEERAQFCFDACVVMRDRFVPQELYRELGWSVPAVSVHLAESGYLLDYKQLLYRRLMPSIKKVGLLTPAIVGKYEMIGALEFQDAETDF